jgi:hypothetical protein
MLVEHSEVGMDLGKHDIWTLACAILSNMNGSFVFGDLWESCDRGQKKAEYIQVFTNESSPDLSLHVILSLSHIKVMTLILIGWRTSLSERLEHCEGLPEHAECIKMFRQSVVSSQVTFYQGSFRISNFCGLSTTEETWLIEIRIWCIKIDIVLVLHFNPWVEA